MKNKLKEKMDNNTKTLGSFHVLGSESVVEILGYAGFDYVLLDTEHGPFDVDKAQSLIRSAKLSGTTPLVRVKSSSRSAILEMLDAGAMGIVIPHVTSVDQVKEIIEYGKYHPMGDRGFGVTVANEYLTAEYVASGIDNLFEVSNRETLLIPQCETKGCLENIEEIVALDGVDGIFVGPYDLSISLGVPGETAGPVMKDAIARVLKACQEAGKFAFIYSSTPEDAKEKFAQGFDSVTYNFDTLLLLDAATKDVQDIKDL
jgi:4-hydroxy-2-oxoheptanedioate aldolase